MVFLSGLHQTMLQICKVSMVWTEYVASRSSWVAGDLLVHEQEHLENIFANTNGIIATHAEDENRLQSRIPQFKHRTDIAAHAECRDIECALIATKRASALAKDHDHRLHVVPDKWS